MAIKHIPVQSKHPNRIRASKSDRIFYTVNGVLLVLIFLITAYPMYLVVISSVSDPTMVHQGKVLLIPRGFTLLGYERTLSHRDLLMSYWNTIKYTVVGVAVNLAFTLPAAYALSVKKLYGRRPLMFLVTFSMYFSCGMIPNYLLIKSLGLLNKFWVMILPGAVSAYNLIVARSFIESNIPDELYEAAQLDGCGRIRFFAKIVLPLSSTLIAILALFYGVGHWNSYMSALLYIQDRDLFPLQVILREILATTRFSPEDFVDPDIQAVLEQMAESMRYSMLLFTSLPVLAIYPFLQKYFVKGITIGSVKG